MQRKAWFEFHDHRLFPAFLRDLVTDGLEAMWNTKNVYAPVLPRLLAALRETGGSRLIDLCSGGGGPWQRLSRDFAEHHGPRLGSSPPSVVLTDKYPNQQAFQRISAASRNVVGFRTDSVDATHIPVELTGFRTMFTSFHHFAPREARAILEDAFNQRQGIAVFDTAKRDARTLLTLFLVPVLAFWLAPQIRPFRWSRIFWTYCLPVVPFTLWFDGVMSCLRSYSQADLRELVAEFTDRNYRWEIGELRGRFVTITYVMGCPAGESLLADIEKPA